MGLRPFISHITTSAVVLPQEVGTIFAVDAAPALLDHETGTNDNPELFLRSTRCCADLCGRKT